jgi:methyl-accepting chemotaxis protein
MASTIKVVIDVVKDSASKSLASLKTDLAGAEGAFGKMKVAGGAAMDSLKSNVAGMAVAAGASLVAFGVKAVGAFNDLALEADRFSDVAGIAVEDASRWIEVAGDIGVSGEAVQGAFQKMNKAIADGKLDQFAADIVRAKDGTVDANASFQNLVTKIGAIKDPTERASAAQKAFGKGYAEIAELMEMSAGEVEAALKGVSDSKVIDESEVEKAKKFRASMDELRDKLEDVTVELGEKLVPAAIMAADALVAVVDVVDGMASAIDDLIGPGSILGRIFRENNELFEAHADKLKLASIWADEFNGSQSELAFGMGDVKTAAEATASGLEKFEGVVGLVADAQTQLEETIAAANAAMLEQAGILQEQIDAQRAAADSAFALRDAEADLAEKVSGANDEMKEADGDLRKVRGVLDDVAQSAGAVADNTLRVWEEQAKANGTTLTATQRQDIWNQSMLNNASTLEGPMRDAVLDYIGQVNGIPPEKLSEIKADIHEGKLADAKAKLDGVSKSRDAAVKADALTDTAEQDLNYLARDRTARIWGSASNKFMDSGGNIPSGQSAIVAERRPEFVNGVLIGGPANVTGGAQTASILNGARGVGGGMNITINMPPGSNGQDVVNAIKKYERTAGPGWRS